jgi:hypothetical protein
MIFYTILIILSIALVVLILGIVNLTKQVESLEDSILFYQEKISEIREMALRSEVQLKELDLRGAFESDDEVGQIFKDIRSISNALSSSILETYESTK